MPRVTPTPAPGPTRPAARPFVKWVGGKRQLIDELRARVPARFGTYFEPFVGGGALFFALQPRRAVLSDLNDRLVRTYRGVRDDVEGVLDLLATYPHSREFFYAQRDRDIDAATDRDLAAWFIYLNKTGFNGLYRVNKSNRFNVPFGRMVQPRYHDAPGLRACAAALKHTDLVHAPFDHVLDRARKGDFVYFDPPYVPLNATSHFTTYTAGGFDFAAQQRLCDVARALKRRGVHVLLSNSAAPLVRELYAGFRIDEVLAARHVNRNVAGRGKIAELLIS